MSLKYIPTAAVALMVALPMASHAAVLDGVGTFEGVAGVGTPNGDVTAPPNGDSSFVYVTTAGSTYMDAGLGLGGETNGSEVTTDAFSADAGDGLEYFFNYVTSDGTNSFVEYSYAFLNNLDAGTSNLIFTARTNPNGDAVPGFDLPSIDPGVTLTPSSTPIIDDLTNWDVLGSSSGACFGGSGNGCGQTGWIQSNFTIADAGNYSFTFGVINWGDTSLQSALAVAGLTVGGDVIIGDPTTPPAVPLPAAGWLLVAGLGGLGVMRRRQKA
ncbi:MAG: NF038132 family protein [Pseudomonadota bacterium]